MEDRESAVLLERHGGSGLGGRRRRTVLLTSLGGLALAAAALVVLVTLASTGTAGGGGRVALEGIDTEHYQSGHKLLYRKIKDLYSWKLDWALGAGPFGASSATFDDYLDRLKTFASDAGKVAGHMQVEEFPEDMRRSIDPSVDPCNDFYEFACGHWEETEGVHIPDESQSNAMQWDVMDASIENAMKGLLETGSGPAANLYRSCMRGMTTPENGKVLEPWLELVDTVVDNVTFGEALVAVNNADMNLFFNWNVDIDSWNKTRYGFIIKPVSTSISGSVLRDGESKWAKRHLGYFRDYIVESMTLAGYDDDAADEDANNIISIETQLAFGQNSSDFQSGYQQWVDRSYLEIQTPSIDWQSWFDGIGFPTAGLEETGDEEEVDDDGQPYGIPRLIMAQGDYPETIEDILSCKGTGGEDIEQEQCWARIRSYMRFKVMQYYAPYLDDQFQDALQDWRNNRFGTESAKSKWRECYEDTTELLGWASSYLWIENTFPKERKEATLRMLSAIREEFRISLEKTRWMDEGSRLAGQEKLDKMFFEVAYPDVWPESVERNDGKVLDSLSYAENMDIIGKNAIERARVRITETPSRSRWGDSYPIVVNAFYSPSVNGLWVPAGIIQKPFYSDKFSDARNYGALGTICGHEMTHGFDDTGHLLDGNGDSSDWWDPKTFAEFDARSNCLEREYNHFGPEEARYNGRHVDGEYTLGENIADEGGMKFAYNAYRRSMPPGRLSMADHRLFFTAFAQNWCEVDRREAMISSLESDEHSPAKYRVLGVLTNFVPFAKAFNCPVGTNMNPAKRCELW